MHQSEISNIERGTASPGYRMLAKLAKGLEAEFALVARGPAARRAALRLEGARTSSRRAPRVPALARTVGAKKR